MTSAAHGGTRNVSRRVAGVEYANVGAMSSVYVQLVVLSHCRTKS
jgi:hypothetical protein